MSWIYLFIAGIFEIVWAVALKHADGFSNWFYSTVHYYRNGRQRLFLGSSDENYSFRNGLRHFGPVSGVLAPLLPAFSCLERLSRSPELFSLRLSPSESLA